ncbi:MAG: hypothetical protein DHS20C18_40230 [Saprospiraceae bacterium]|nr:MAG: hypothetical protein DHS20C18_40230 [Saprospiraceae bacterium]
MKRLFNNLPEKDKRHYASVEAFKLEYGGIEYISELFGIYDIPLNDGYIFLGQSADTPDFAVDCLLDYIKYYAIKRHPQASQMLILCDSGAVMDLESIVLKK